MCFLQMLGFNYERRQDGHQEMTLRDGATAWGKPGDAFRRAAGFFSHCITQRSRWIGPRCFTAGMKPTTSPEMSGRSSATSCPCCGARFGSAVCSRSVETQIWHRRSTSPIPGGFGGEWIPLYSFSHSLPRILFLPPSSSHALSLGTI